MFHVFFQFLEDLFATNTKNYSDYVDYVFYL